MVGSEESPQFAGVWPNGNDEVGLDLNTLKKFTMAVVNFFFFEVRDSANASIEVHLGIVLVEAVVGSGHADDGKGFVAEGFEGDLAFPLAVEVVERNAIDPERVAQVCGGFGDELILGEFGGEALHDALQVCLGAGGIPVAIGGGIASGRVDCHRFSR